MCVEVSATATTGSRGDRTRGSRKRKVMYRSMKDERQSMQDMRSYLENPGVPHDGPSCRF